MRTDKLFLAATLAFSASAFDALAQSSDDGYVRSAPAGVFVKSPFGACVRTGYWTPAMANSECDPDLVPKPAAAPAPSRAAPPPPPPPPAAAPAPKPTVVTLKSSELFEFNKATLTPAARAKLDSEVVAKIREVRNLRFVNVNGHTDRLGSAQYNQKLSEKRAEAVKAYLVSKGVDASKVETYGFGKTLPVKSCPDQKSRKALIECLAPNRRVEVEIQGAPQ
jgi:OOP family OmpA-OmpF porin